MAHEHNESPPFEGMLDLDEPETPAEDPYADVPPPPDWSPDDPVIIDVAGHIHVRGGRFFESRVVGRVRGDEGEATIGALVARFEEIQERLRVLEREVKGSRNLVRSLKTMRSYVHWVEGANAIGDFAGLLERAHGIVNRLDDKIDASRRTKQRLVAEAEELASSTAWKSTGEVMERLMDDWKKAGSAGGAEDDALWERFRAARKDFFERRSENFAERKKQWAKDRKLKEELIARAEALSDSTDWDATSDEMQQLFEQWKSIGSAGRKVDDELWNRFRAARDPFFERRKAHFAEQRRRRGPREGRGPNERRRQGSRHDQGGGGRPGRTPRRSGPARGGSSGTLHASLAEILGPMSDLLKAKEKDKNAAGPKKKEPSNPKKR